MADGNIQVGDVVYYFNPIEQTRDKPAVVEYIGDYIEYQNAAPRKNCVAYLSNGSWHFVWNLKIE